MLQAQLPQLRLEILKLLWCESHTGNSSGVLVGGLTRDEIFALLKDKAIERRRAGEAVREPLVGALASLKRPLLQMSEGKPVYLKRTKAPDLAGLTYVYSINDLEVATWPSTAFMLIYVWKAGRHMQTRDLVDAMIRQTAAPFLRGPGASHQEWKEEIEKQIGWCLSQSYLTYVEGHDVTALRASERIQYEYKFLEFVASR